MHTTTKSVKFEQGEWWYVGPKYRQRLESHVRKNKTRMFVDGKYVPKSHPMHKPGTYKTFEDAWTHKELDRAQTGYVYAVVNPAWPGWVKVGRAVDAQDRLKSYQTGSPKRDYSLLASIKTDDKNLDEKKAHRLFEQNADGHQGEWFQIGSEVAYAIITDLEMLPDPLQSAE